jgi:flagellar biosynthetic protein FliR
VLIRLELQWLVTVSLLSVRLAALLWSSPLFVMGRVPSRALVPMVLVFSACLAISQPAAAFTGPLTLAAWSYSAAGELLVGLLMSFGLHAAFAAFSFGGRLLDLQIGFGVASLINPASQEQESLIGTALLAVGVMTFYLMDGHHLIVKSVVQSLHWFPVGRPLSQLPMDAALAQFGLMFSLGTMLVAPVVAALLLVDVALAMASRTMPQMNIFMLSIPVKIVIGLSILAASTAFMPGVFRRIYQSIFDYWAALV